MGYAVSLVKESEVMTIQKDYTPLIKKTLKRQYYISLIKLIIYTPSVAHAYVFGKIVHFWQ